MDTKEFKKNSKEIFATLELENKNKNRNGFFMSLLQIKCQLSFV